mmetsp:Transcript_21913/g.46431  ORF Transcript_21913/g.46431 Transcript_21913/m.46431 type:complete len:591 (+) Transcript_21913:196-1968(+)
MWFRLVIIARILTSVVYGDEYTHRYTDGEEVIIWVNKVGPYHNPQETYVYYSLPFCSSRPVDELEHRWDGLGEVLEGNDLISSGLKLRFREPVRQHTKVCQMKLDEESSSQLQYAVHNHYWYQWYIDDLPVWGMVGEVSLNDGESVEAEPNGEALVYTHKKFSISYNGNQIIQVNLTSENPVTLGEEAQLEFTYSVDWVPTELTFSRRFDRYLDYDFFEHQIHWFSIFNSFMMVIFLTGIVTLILMRTLRKDYAKYAREAGDLDELDQELDESGWKQVHGDVFRPPQHLGMFCALVGTGSQLATMVFVMILFATATTLYMGRGAILIAFIMCYSLASVVCGYTSGSLYARSGGRAWIPTMLYSASIFPVFCFTVMFVLNVVALLYKSLAATPFTSILSVMLIWLFVSLPLCVLGTILGRHFAGQPNFPCRVNAIPRLIPDKRWYARPLVLIGLGGVLPFGSIFIEMYFVFTSFWNYKFYYVYGFLFLVFIILTIVTVCVTIVVTYFLLNNEDYRWPWTSFCASASTAIYVFLYSVYYFFVKTKMSGFFQTVFYFGYMGMFCLGLALMCGTLGYMGCSVFVRRIYQNIKSD